LSTAVVWHPHCLTPYAAGIFERQVYNRGEAFVSQPAQSLRELIDQAKIKHDTESLRELSRIGRLSGGTLSHGTLAAISKGTYKVPRPTDKTIQELADLAGVSFETAFAAAGLGTPPPKFADQIPDRFNELWPEHRDVVLIVARALLNAQVNHNSDTASEWSSFSTDRVTTKEGTETAWADEEGIFGSNEGHGLGQEM
jgi:hypothetical protein